MEKRKLIAALVILIFTNIFVGAQVRTEIIPIAQSEEWETVNWNFELNPQTYEATLVSPVDGAYKFINPGIDCIVASDGFNCSFWSPSVTGMAGESLYFTAIKIPETVMSSVDGKTYTVTAIGDRAFAHSNIAYIHVPNTVLAIGEEAFTGCASLVGIDYVSAYELVPHSVTSLGKGAFKDCSSLKRIDIGDGVTEILPETFDGCTSLQYIKIGASVIKISCILPPLEGIAFHSPAPPQLIHPLSAEEIWAPIADLYAYKVRFGDVKGFGIKPRQENTLKFYTGATRPVYIDIVSAPVLKADPTEKYHFIYRAMDFGGMIPGYREIIASHLNANVTSKKTKDLPYTIYFSDTQAGIIHSPNVFPSSTDSTMQVGFNAPGEYELTVVSNDFTRASYTWKVNVIEGVPVDRMLVDGPLILAPGQTGQCTPLFYGDLGTPTITDVIWHSDNEEVLTVDAAGIVTAVGEGTAKVIARSADPACPEKVANHQITVSQTGIAPFPVLQSVATNTSVSSHAMLKATDKETEFYISLTDLANSYGMIAAPTVTLSHDATKPSTPYNFPYPGAESLTINGIKHMSSPVLEELVITDYNYSAYESYSTPLTIPCSVFAIWDERAGFVDIVRIGDYAFAGSNIKYAHLAASASDGPSRTTELGSYVFAECHSFKGIPEGSAYDVVPDRITKMGRGVFKNCDNMEIMAIGDGITVLPEETFDGCTALRQVRLGAGIKTINCSVTASEVIVVASPEVPVIAPGCTLSAPEILVPAASLDKYSEEWTWAELKPYGIVVEDGRADIRAYISQNRSFKIDVQGYRTDGTCTYRYPYVTSSSSLTYLPSRGELPFYRAEFEKSVVSTFDPGKSSVSVKLNKATDITFISTDITRTKLTVPFELKSGIPVSRLTVYQPASEVLTVGGSKTLTASVMPTNATQKTVEWTVSDPKIAVIDAKGKLTALKKGSVIVTATTTDPYSDTFTASATVEIKGEVTDMVMTFNSHEILTNDTIFCDIDDILTFGANITPEGKYAAELKWSFETVSDKIASFDESTGALKAISAGICTLRVTMPKEFTYSDEDIVKTVIIKVNAPAVKPVEPENPDPIEPGVPTPTEPDNPEPAEPTEPDNPDPEEPDYPNTIEPDPEEPEDDPEPEKPAAITGVESGSVTVMTEGCIIYVKGVPASTVIKLYSIDGMLVRYAKVTNETTTLIAPRPGLYILLADRAYKLSLR